MLVESLDWRAEYEVDTILEWFPSSAAGQRIMAYYPNYEVEGAKVWCQGRMYHRADNLSLSLSAG